MSTPETTPRSVVITNCHVHTFTYKHVPDRFVPWPAGLLLRRKVIRVPVLGFIRRWDKDRRTRFARYARVVEHSYNRDQEAIFRSARSYYPEGTRFVVLPMDMYPMKAGEVEEPIDTQHSQLRELLDNQELKNVLIPFAAVDPRQPDVVEKTKALLANGFRGIKLYPPIGYHPYDQRLHKLYEHAEAHGIPVMTHCSRPAGVSYRGAVTPEMRENPAGGNPLPQDRKELLEIFTDPEAYLPILRGYPQLRLCLAHFGGAADWRTYLEDPWGFGVGSGKKSWLAKIVELLKNPDYPNLFTDISYTVFADDEYVHMLKVLLSQDAVAESVLFGSDFYVVEDAKNEERRIAMRIRSVLGEDLFRQIAEENPKRYLGF